jgi:AcrR family transcriptional regulator
MPNRLQAVPASPTNETGNSRNRRTRMGVTERRQQIIDATHQVALERGLNDLRIADVAEALGVSTGLIHYHFDTRDELIEVMLRETSEAGIAEELEILASLPTPELKMARLIDDYVPTSDRDPIWVLWIHMWGDAMRDRNIRRISEALDIAWLDMIISVIVEGVEAGAFRCDNPYEAAWRIGGLCDGLGIQIVLNRAKMTWSEVRGLVRHAAALELGVELPDLTRKSAARIRARQNS